MSATQVDLERPLRYPDTSSAPLMTKRAFWLIVLGFLLPGSAQMLAGNKKLGRFGITVTIIMWLGAIGALVGALNARVATLSLFTNSFFLLGLQVVVVFVAIMWIIIGFDTLRMVKLVKVKPTWRIPIVLLSVILTIVPSVGAAWAASTINAGREAISSLFRSAPPIDPIDGRYNIMLLGTDAGADREGLRPDSISLVSVDAKTGQSVIVGIPRDMYNVPFPETSPLYQDFPNGFGVDWGCDVGDCKINAVYAEAEYFYDESPYPDAEANGSTPGIEATRDAVEGVTGLKPQFYVLLNMDAFEHMIDALGGVTINVEEDLPIGGDADGNGITGWVQAGERKLSGYEAQWYARSRYGSERGDWDRMDRQRKLQAAILAQMKPQNVLTRFQEIAAAGTELVETDIPDSMLGPFVDLAAKASGFPPVNVELTPPAVDPEYPDFDEIHELVRQGVAAATPVEEE